MQTATQLVDRLSEFADVQWIPGLLGRARVRASCIMTQVHLKLGMLTRQERLALARCLAKVEWYLSCGHLLGEVEIPSDLRSVIRRSLYWAVLDHLVPPQELEKLKRLWRYPWKLGHVFGVSDRMARDAVRLRRQRGKPPEAG